VTLDDAVAADAVITVTPGKEILFAEGSLGPGQHVSLMGADGPGKAEIATAELARARLFCDAWAKGVTKGIQVRLFVDDWEQASHGGETAYAVEAGSIGRKDVTDLGKVLTGEALGRQHPDDITLFDSTGLAIQDLAIAIAAYAKAGDLDLPTMHL
jgi:ornithine cyclodeaminase/alanine dehydrogenase-like protein (mu-crystallin family)